MSKLKLLLGAVAAAALVAAFRDTEGGRWLRPSLPVRGGRDAWDDDEEEDDDEGYDDVPEPILGYDGMDRDTLVAHLRRSGLDEDTLRDVYDYERERENRTLVLETVLELLDEFAVR